MKRQTGFTLIELMVTIAIVAILAAVAIPVFSEQLAKGRRSEAISTLTQLQLRQERWRANHGAYADMAELTGSAAAATAFNTAQDNYDFHVTSGTNTGTDVELTATPKNAQAGDRCGVFKLRIDNDNSDPPAGMVDKTTSTGAERCW